MQTPEIFILSARRTAIGTFGGALKDVPLCDLATTAVKAALITSQIDPQRIGHVVIGNVIPTAPQDAYLARVAAINAGIPKQTPRLQRQPPLRLGAASDHFCRPHPDARRCGLRHRRRS